MKKSLKIADHICTKSSISNKYHSTYTVLLKKTYASQGGQRTYRFIKNYLGKYPSLGYVKTDQSLPEALNSNYLSLVMHIEIDFNPNEPWTKGQNRQASRKFPNTKLPTKFKHNRMQITYSDPVLIHYPRLALQQVRSRNTRANTHANATDYSYHHHMGGIRLMVSPENRLQRAASSDPIVLSSIPDHNYCDLTRQEANPPGRSKVLSCFYWSQSSPNFPWRGEESYYKY